LGDYFNVLNESYGLVSHLNVIGTQLLYSIPIE